LASSSRPAAIRKSPTKTTMMMMTGGKNHHHNPWSWVNTVASLHLDAVTPNFLIQEVITEPEPWKDACVVGAPVMDPDGYFALPGGPGLGIEVDLGAVEHFPPVTGRPPALWHEDGSVADW
jgi:galactonate dehydratase